MRGRAKTLLILVGALLACVAVALVTLRIVGLDPKDRRPGLWLTGDLVTTPVTDWSFTDKYPTIFVQTRSWYEIGRASCRERVESEGGGGVLETKKKKS